MKDFYYILGVNPESTLLEIIEAYEKLSPKFDPVLNGHDSFYTKQFTEIREAFHVLTDPAKRKQYDDQLKTLNTTAIKPKKSLADSITPKIDVTFSLILILLTGVFGSYVYRSVYQNRKKTTVISQPIAITPPVAPTINHHKQKKHIKHKALLVAKTNYAIKQPVAVAAMPIKANVPVSNPAVKTSIPVTYAISKPAVANKPQPLAAIEQPVNEAEIRANETGVVYLREYAQFRAPVIKTLQDRDKIIILEKGSKYYKVQCNELTGFIPKWAVKLNEQE